MIKNYWLIIIIALVFTACGKEEIQEEENICVVCEEFPGTYVSDVKYSYWAAIYDSDGEFLYWEYYENETRTNEIEVILIDWETKKFQLNNLYRSWLVDIPAFYDEDNQRLEFEHEISRNSFSHRILKGSATFSNDSLFIESTLFEHGVYYSADQIFESYISEVGIKQ